jgi:hypothetical protein
MIKQSPLIQKRRLLRLSIAVLGIPMKSSTDSGHAVQRWREATLVVEIINQLDGMVMTERTFR